VVALSTTYAKVSLIIAVAVKTVFAEAELCRGAKHVGTLQDTLNQKPVIDVDFVPDLLHNCWFIMWMAGLTM
jgi:hypothetical protein